jgi:hypothetical protein
MDTSQSQMPGTSQQVQDEESRFSFTDEGKFYTRAFYYFIQFKCKIHGRLNIK